MMTLDYFVRRALRRHGERIAIVDRETEITYAELDRRSEALASVLATEMPPGARIATILQNRSEFIEAEIATLKAGMVKAPINPRLALPEMVAILADCEASAVIAETEFASALERHRQELPSLRLIVTPSELSGLRDRASPGRVRSEAAPDSLALLRFSGGTTGKPKGIMHSHQSLVSIALSVVREYELHAEERHLQVGHLSHGQNFFWPALFAVGARMVMLPKFDPLTVLQLVERHRITRLHLVPTMVNAVFFHPRFGEFDTSSLKTVVYASAPIAPDTVERLHALLGPRLVQVYTLSESAVITTILRKEDHVPRSPRLASCGREALDVRLRIVGEDGEDVPLGEVGELIVSSPGNMIGYWKQPEATAATLRDGWVYTGDLARQDAEGFVYLVDRKDDKIVTGALNVYPREVEDVLYAHPQVRECAVIGIPDDRWGEAVTAFLAPRPGAIIDVDEISRFCRERVAGYKVPKRIVVMDELPKTAVGKISRRALREPYWTDRERRIN